MADNPSARPLTDSDPADPVWNRSRRRRLESLGYEVMSLRRAFDVLTARARKGNLPQGVNEGVLACADGLAPREEPGLSGTLTGAGLPLRVAVAPDGALTLVRQTGLGTADDGDPGDWLSTRLTDHVAWTLVRWPSLRRFWIQELRLEHYQHLFALGPKLWWVDTTPLPPGGVIPDLDLPGWDRLPLLISHQPERRFTLLCLPLGTPSGWTRISVREVPASEWPSMWRATHAAVANAGGLCLIQEQPRDAQQLFEADYALRDGRIRMTCDPRPL